MAQCDAQALVNAAACFCGLSPKQVGMVELALLCKIWQAANPMANCDVHDLMKDAKCFAGLPIDQQNAIIIQLLCEVLHSGGTGQTCLLCGVGAPVDAAPCDCSIYYTLPPNAGVWVWDSVGVAWEAVINPGT